MTKFLIPADLKEQSSEDSLEDFQNDFSQQDKSLHDVLGEIDYFDFKPMLFRGE